MADKSSIGGKLANTPWKMLGWAVLFALIVFGVAVAIILWLAPNPWGWAATLRDWQTFLAGVFGFAGLLAGTVLNAAENRQRDTRLHQQTLELNEKLHLQTLKRDADIREQDRRALAATLIGEIGYISRACVYELNKIREMAGEKVISIPQTSSIPELSGKLGLLEDIKTIASIGVFKNSTEEYREKKIEVGPQGYGTVSLFFLALLGAGCIVRLSITAEMSQSERDKILSAICFDEIPDELFELEGQMRRSREDKEIVAVVQQIRKKVLREERARNTPGTNKNQPDHPPTPPD